MDIQFISFVFSSACLTKFKYNFFFYFGSLFGDSLIVPLQEKIDEWKKSVNHFDKENSKGMSQNENNLVLKLYFYSKTPIFFSKTVSQSFF